MHVPFVDLELIYRQNKPEIDEAIGRVLESQRFIMGPEVAAFEQEMASYLESDVHCMGTSSGTSALFLSLMALEVNQGDEVIVPAYSFIATANTVSLNRAKPVFVDVEPDTLNLDCNQVADRINAKTKAIVPVHLFGRSVDFDQLGSALSSANRADLPILEDAAQAVGSAFGG